MTAQREYLVALDVRSTLHAWIAAASEEAAIKASEELGIEAADTFTAKGGRIESAVVLESRPAQTATPLRRFRIAFRQLVVHRIDVEAADLDTAITEAEQLYEDGRNFFTDRPPAGWDRSIYDWDLDDAEEVPS